MAFLGGLRVVLDAATDQFNAKIADAANKLDSAKAKMNIALAGIQRGFGSVQNKISSFTRDIFSLHGALGLLLGGTGLLAIGKAAIDAGDNIEKMAERLKISTQRMQELQYAAKLANTDFGTLEEGLSQINKRLGVADAGGKDPFKDWGISIKDATGKIKGADEILAEVADRFKAADSGAAQAKLEFDTMGKSSEAMGNLLAKGSEGLRQTARDANNLGIVLSGHATKAASDFTDEMTTMGEVIRNNFQEGFLSGFLDDSRSLKDIYSDPQFAANVKHIAEDLGQLFKFMVDHGRDIIAVAGAFAGAAAGGTTGAVAGSFFGPVGTAVGGAIGAAGGGLVGMAGGYNMTRRNGLGPALPPNASFERPQTVDQATVVSGWTRDKNGNVHPPTPKIPHQPSGEETKELREAAKVYEQTRTNAELYAQQVDALDKLLAQGKISQDSYNQAVKDSKDVTDQTHDAAVQYGETVQELNKLLAKGKITQDTYTRALEAARDKASDTKEIAKELGLTFQSAFEDAAVQGKSFGEVLRGLAQDLEKLFIRRQITEPLFNFISKGLSGGGGILDFLGGGDGTTVDDFMPSVGDYLGFASGGSVSAGQMFRVNEYGTEGFKPNASGQIIPLGEMNKMGGNVYQIDATGADQGAVQRIGTLLQQWAGPGVVERRVLDAQKRGAL